VGDVGVRDDLGILPLQAREKEALDLIDGIDGAASLSVIGLVVWMALARERMWKLADWTPTLLLRIRPEIRLEALTVEAVTTKELHDHCLFDLVLGVIIRNKLDTHGA
jgi:hypothetical protein